MIPECIWIFGAGRPADLAGSYLWDTQMRFWVPTSWTWSASNASGASPSEEASSDVEIGSVEGVNSLRCFWWAAELLVANTWRAWHWWVLQPCWQLCCATLNNWEKLGMESCAPKRKKVAFSSFSMPQEGTALTLMPGACSGPGGKLIVTDMDRIEAWWACCALHLAKQRVLSKKIVHSLLWSFFQVCYFYFLTIRLQASSFPHTSLPKTCIRYWYIHTYTYISACSIHNMKIESVTTLRISDSATYTYW